MPSYASGVGLSRRPAVVAWPTLRDPTSDGTRLMLTALPAAMGRLLDRLRERGEAVDVVDLAQRLLSLESPPELPLARRVVPL